MMTLLQMSVQGGLIIVITAIVRVTAQNKLPKEGILGLWAVALARLLIPLSFSTKWSIYGILGSLLDSSSAYSNATRYKAAVALDEMLPQLLAGANMEKLAWCAPSAIAMVWFSIMVVLFSVFAVLILKTYRELRFAIPLEENAALTEWRSSHKLVRPLRILQSERVTSPLAIGIFRPRIILPKTMGEGNSPILNYVLTHEFFHIRRFDMVWKLFAICAACIHWMNPLVWMMLALLNRDLELACDELVLRHLGGGIKEKKAYAYSLIQMAETRSKDSPIGNYFSRNAAEERIISIMKYKKASALAVAAAVLLVLGVTTTFAASGDSNAGESTQTAHEEEMLTSGGTIIYANRNDAAYDGYVRAMIGHTEFYSETLNCVDGTAPAHEERNAQMAVYTNAGGTWDLKAGQTVTLCLHVERVLGEGNGWSLYVGYLKDGVYEVASMPRIASGITTLALSIPEDGRYAFFIVNVSAGSIHINRCTVTV